MSNKIHIRGPQLERSADCEPILNALPAWFGIPSAVTEYLKDIHRLPTFLAMVEAEVVGFLTLNLHNSFSAEVHVMGILPDYHRQGIGAELMKAAENYLCEKEMIYLQVKTLSANDPDPNYALTRAFYEKMGFVPLQEWPDLWGPENPCVQLVKMIAA